MKTAELLANAWLDKYAYGDDAVLARVAELAADAYLAGMEEAARMLGEDYLADGEAHYGWWSAERIREAAAAAKAKP